MFHVLQVREVSKRRLLEHSVKTHNCWSGFTKQSDCATISGSLIYNGEFYIFLANIFSSHFKQNTNPKHFFLEFQEVCESKVVSGINIKLLTMPINLKQHTWSFVDCLPLSGHLSSLDRYRSRLSLGQTWATLKLQEKQSLSRIHFWW